MQAHAQGMSGPQPADPADSKRDNSMTKTSVKDERRAVMHGPIHDSRRGGR